MSEAEAFSSAGEEEPTARLDFAHFIRQDQHRLEAFSRLIADDPEEGRDALQEALIIALGQWPKVSTMENPRGWVCRVIRRKLYQLRQARRRLTIHPLNADPEAAGDSAETVVASLTLREAVSQLPARQREIIGLQLDFDLTISEIALILNTAESTVRSNRSRARTRLRDLLAPPRREDA